MPCAGCVDNASLAAGAVGTTNILDGAVTNDKLAVLAQPGLVQNSATTATDENVPGAIIARDGSGSFAAGAAALEVLQLTGATSLATRFTLGGDPFLRASSTATFLGIGAGANASGPSSVAMGANAAANATGTGSVAIGAGAGLGITSGARNTAVGMEALGGGAVTGDGNVAIGANALGGLTGASVGNIAIGTSAGRTITSGSFNIYLSHDGFDESNTIRIGHPTVQNRAFIAGVRGSTVIGDPVLVSSDGQLGVASSSASVKHDVRDMGSLSARIYDLRPVAFRYLPSIDESQSLMYGLIAEEVDGVMPELVSRSTDGAIETVRYHLLAPLLLNEVQRLRTELDAAMVREADLAAAIARLESRLESLTTGMDRAQAAHAGEALTADETVQP
ncbi:MAG TPA: tail fiber domain-containing protein [Longimicrobiales bacterium]|nr:tail fiber domain-containing protein [Longimicrobiales bacterium]